MYTKNCREAIRSLSLFRSKQLEYSASLAFKLFKHFYYKFTKGFFRWIYEKTRLPLVPIYGLFPVKMITYLGKPIEYDENRSVEQLVELVC